MNAVPIPIIHYDEEAASAAFAAYQAMIARERTDPALASNPAWWRLRSLAYQQFERAYEAPL